MYCNTDKLYSHALASADVWRILQMIGQGSIIFKRSFPFKLKSIPRLSLFTSLFENISNAATQIMHQKYNSIYYIDVRNGLAYR
jgi:hypothetical protein